MRFQPGLEIDLWTAWHLCLGEQHQCQAGMQVPAAYYGLNILDILRAPEKELNQVVGMKRLAPYREDAGRFRPQHGQAQGDAGAPRLIAAACQGHCMQCLLTKSMLRAYLVCFKAVLALSYPPAFPAVYASSPQ